MKLGEPDLLFPGKASCFVVSTGTTGVPKYIPESDAGALAKNIVSRMRIRAWRRMLPEVFTPESKIFPITNAAVYERTEGGIPAGSASGLTAASGKGKRQPRNVIPPALLTTPELAREDTDYLMMLFAFAEKNVACIALNNVAHFHLLWNVVRERPYDFIDDIRQGTLSAQVPDEARKALLEDWRANPERADELEALLNSRGTLEPGDVWPHLRMVVCWIAGSVGRSAQEYRSMFPPETVFVNWGYGASEGKFDVPVEAESVEGVLALFGYVYEFVKPGESVAVPLWEAADDTPYELVFTNYAGFYRYNIHDLVSLGTNADGLCTIRFLGKTSDSISIAGHAL